MERLGWLAFCLAGLAVSVLLLPEHPPFTGKAWRIDGMLDASAFRAGAMLVGQGGLYDPQVIAKIEAQDTGETATRVYLRAPWYAVATKWLAWPPAPVAMALWKALLLLCGVWFALLWQKPWWAGAALCWSLPFAGAIEQGQDTPILLLSFALSLALASRGRDFAGGMIFALGTIKPHFLIPCLVVLCCLRRWRFLGGMLSAGCILTVVSFAAEGRNWPFAYLEQLKQPGWYNSVTASANLIGITPLFPHETKAALSLALLLGACAAAALVIARRTPFEFAMWASLALGVAASFHAYLQDAMLFVPVALFALDSGLSDAKRYALFVLSPASSYALAAWVPVAGPALAVLPVLALIAYLSKQESLLRPGRAGGAGGN